MRKRHEHQIAILDSYDGREFERALARILNRNAGLSWFTDEQVADIRAEMIERELFRHNLNRENRKRMAADRRNDLMREGAL